MRTLPLFLAAPLLALALPAAAQEAPARPAATAADLDWLAGHWAGEGIGDHPAGESFSYAGPDRMVGHFWQLDAEGAVEFYELITITPDGDSLTMRLKHFTGDLTGWEEKPGDTALNFPLTARSDTVWVFGPVTITRIGPDRLDLTVRVRQDDGTLTTLAFVYRRVTHG